MLAPPIQSNCKGEEDAARRATRTGVASTFPLSPRYLIVPPLCRGCVGHGDPEQSRTTETFLQAARCCAVL